MRGILRTFDPEVDECALCFHTSIVCQRVERRTRCHPSNGSLAGFVSPYVIGWIIDKTHSTDLGVYTLAACLTIGGLLVLGLPKRLVNH